MINEYDVACLLDSDSADELRQTIPFLEKDNRPHVSLFQFKCRDQRFLSRIKSELSSLSFSKRFLTSAIAPAGCNVFLDILDDSTLSSASTRIMKLYLHHCQYKEPLSQIDLNRLDEEQARLVRQYGIHWVCQNFRPHVTLLYNNTTYYDLNCQLPVSVGLLPVGLYPIDPVGRILPLNLA